jgi:hypothetical protein
MKNRRPYETKSPLLPAGFESFAGCVAYSAVLASIERFTLPEGVGMKTNRGLPGFGCLSISEVSYHDPC